MLFRSEKNCPNLSQSNGLFPFSNPAQLLMIEAFAIGIPSFFLALQPNHKKVSGKFLWNIVKGALPGAIAIGFSTIVTYVLAGQCGFKPEEITTIIVLIATSICIMVLWNACRPYSVWKVFLLAFMVSLCAIVVLGSWFNWSLFNLNFRTAFQLVPLFSTYSSSSGEQWNLTMPLLAFSLVASGYVIMTSCAYIIHNLEINFDNFKERVKEQQKNKN